MAGQSTREIKRRIRSIENTQHITKAMEMVSAAKLRRAQQQVMAARPFADKLREVLGRVGRSARAGKYAGDLLMHPMLHPGDKHKALYVVITGQRGLAGGYNVNIFRKVEELLRAGNKEAALVTVGRKGREYFQRTGRKIMADISDLGDDITFSDARQLTAQLVRFYVEQDFGEVRVIYTYFVSAMTQIVKNVQLLPIKPLEEMDEDVKEPFYLFEPSPEVVMNALLPRYVENEVYRALVEAKASEHGARMTAMRNASDNAQEMINDLTLSYNRARQATITTEIAEIVGGSNAMRGQR